MTRFNRIIVKIVYMILIIGTLYHPLIPNDYAKKRNNIEFKVAPSSEYKFIWEEFEGALGDLPGDDILTYAYYKARQTWTFILLG